jgi:hypothetical protein
MVKFWMCQKCGKMKDYNEKMTTNTVEWLHTLDMIIITK